MQKKWGSKWKKIRKTSGIWPGRCSSITRTSRRSLKIIDANVAAHDDLQQRERELAAEKERVAKQTHENELAATRNAEQAAADEAEAQRLRDEAVSLQAAKSAAAYAEKPAKATKT